jgi:hypothetical protein
VPLPTVNPSHFVSHFLFSSSSGEPFGYEDGKTYNRAEFQKRADQFKIDWFKNHPVDPSALGDSSSSFPSYASSNDMGTSSAASLVAAYLREMEDEKDLSMRNSKDNDSSTNTNNTTTIKTEVKEHPTGMAFTNNFDHVDSFGIGIKQIISEFWRVGALFSFFFSFMFLISLLFFFSLFCSRLLKP